MCFLLGAICFLVLGIVYFKTELVHSVMYFFATGTNALAAVFQFFQKQKSPEKKSSDD